MKFICSQSHRAHVAVLTIKTMDQIGLISVCSTSLVQIQDLLIIFCRPRNKTRSSYSGVNLICVPRTAEVSAD